MIRSEAVVLKQQPPLRLRRSGIICYLGFCRVSMIRINHRCWLAFVLNETLQQERDEAPSLCQFARDVERKMISESEQHPPAFLL